MCNYSVDGFYLIHDIIIDTILDALFKIDKHLAAAQEAITENGRELFWCPVVTIEDYTADFHVVEQTDMVAGCKCINKPACYNSGVSTGRLRQKLVTEAGKVCGKLVVTKRQL